ncbi:MAG: DMT family transporter [Cytophagaceae bacterium]
MKNPLNKFLVSREFYGLLLIFTGAILFSSKAILVKLSYRFEEQAVSILALRMIFSLPFFLIIALLSKRDESKPKPERNHWLLIVGLGIAGYYFSSLMDFMGLQYISASLERLILFIYPTLVILISAFLFKVKIKSNEIIALCMTYGGIIFVILTDFNMEQKSLLKGSVLIFLSAFSYAVYLIGSGKLIPIFGAVRFTAFAMIISCITVLIHFVCINDIGTLFTLPYQVYIYTLLMAIVSTVVPSFMLSEGIKLIGSEKASIIGSIGPVSTIFLAWVFLGEVINSFQIIGALMVIAGIIMLQGYGYLIQWLKSKSKYKRGPA